MGAYPTVCPNCGGQLEPVVLGPESAPWLCHGCGLGFWAAELRQSAAWDRGYRCFGHAGMAARVEAVHAEAVQAVARGSSARPDQLALLPTAVLERLAQVSSDRTFVAQVQAALTARGV